MSSGSRASRIGLHFRHSTLAPLLLDRSPRFVRVEKLHLLELIEGSRSKVLLVHNAVVADDETSHPRLSVFCGGSDQGKAADHYSLHHKVYLAERRSRALSLQDFEEVAMVGLAGLVALIDRSCDLLAYGTAPRAV